MKHQWHDLSDKFLQLTSREQALLFLTGVVAIIFIILSFFIDDKSAQIITFDKQSRTITTASKSLDFSIKEFQTALKQDPDIAKVKQVTQFEAKLAKIDSLLLHLTTELISPSEMRQALLKLLNLEPGVSLLSFQLIGAQPLLDLSVPNKGEKADRTSPTVAQLGLNLYKHGIKIKLSGQYFQLRNYLQQLEKLSWKFFWQEFQFQVKDYPRSEVDITIYSLGLNKEFIGV
jgi:MSHA biogenesis protein MshJ